MTRKTDVNDYTSQQPFVLFFSLHPLCGSSLTAAATPQDSLLQYSNSCLSQGCNIETCLTGHSLFALSLPACLLTD